MVIVIILLVVAAIIYFRLASDSPEVKRRGKGRPEEQKQALRYFLNDGFFQKKPTDQQYDEMVSSKVKQLQIDTMQRALSKLGIDESEVQEIAPIFFANYVFGMKNTYSRMGKDGNWRSSAYQVSWLFFGPTQVYLYQYTFNTDEDGKKEHTEEYFYKDIVNFTMSNDTEETPIWDKKKHEFVLKNVDSCRFRIVVPGESLYCAMTQSDKNERAVHGMKAKLREKKNA